MAFRNAGRFICRRLYGQTRNFCMSSQGEINHTNLQNLHKQIEQIQLDAMAVRANHEYLLDGRNRDALKVFGTAGLNFAFAFILYDTVGSIKQKLEVRLPLEAKDLEGSSESDSNGKDEQLESKANSLVSSPSVFNGKDKQLESKNGEKIAESSESVALGSAGTSDATTA